MTRVASQNFHASSVNSNPLLRAAINHTVNPIADLAPMQATAQRQRWMSVLAKANAGEIDSACRPLGTLPHTQWLRKPETGLVMVRGRAGGSGAKFNLGEMPVTRCAVRLNSHDGVMGVAWVQGRDARHAELAARLDALLQVPAHHDRIQRHVIQPLAAMQAARRDLAARKAAATKVDFYTLARGEDK
jgi:alpha-D-ribose 1-methylphosphonate 5-triphosphate synthase subunit PhnG